MRANKLFIFIILFIFGCNSLSDKIDHEHVAAAVEKSDNNCRELKIKKNDLSELLNFTDKNNLKQGRWEDTNIWRSDTIIEVKTYKDNTLHGYSAKGNRFCRSECTYKNGQIDGCFYYLADGKCRDKGYGMIVFYENGVKRWAAFGCDHMFVFPVKGFHLRGDSVCVIAPYINGKTWYEGCFVKVDDSLKTRFSNDYVGIGRHRVYCKNGEIHAVIDYDNLMLKVYSEKSSNEFKEYTFMEFLKTSSGPAFKYVQDKYWVK